ncbi:rhodanese-related sulfurtransferase [Spelaeicoccus albus]
MFYVFTPLPDPDAIRLWQWTLAEREGLTGRILISEHGINATLGGDIDSVKRYVKATKGYAAFKRADFKWSDGAGNDFPKLSVKVRPEIVSFGAPDALKVGADGVLGGGKRLAPQEVHDLVDERGDDVVFFDGRNKFEAEIGRFAGAVVPDVDTTRDFVAELDSGKYDHLKSRPVVTYCTGGVRCEVLSSLMTERGFDEVYQLDGGIVRYGEEFKDDGLWQGSLYVFDGRMHVEFGKDTVPLGRCSSCGAATAQYHNCANLECRRLRLFCETCAATLSGTVCPEDCRVVDGCPVTGE